MVIMNEIVSTYTYISTLTVVIIVVIFYRYDRLMVRDIVVVYSHGRGQNKGNCKYIYTLIH